MSANELLNNINPVGFQVNTQMNYLQSDFIKNQLKRIMETEGKDVGDLATALKMPYQTLLNYSNGSRQPKWDFLERLDLYGINLHWFVTGDGSMYRANAGACIHKDDGSDVQYRVNVKNSKGVANVVNNHGVNNGNIVAQGGTDRIEQGGNEQLVIEFVKWFMKNHSAEDQVWLIGQLSRSIPEFKEWRDNPPT